MRRRPIIITSFVDLLFNHRTEHILQKQLPYVSISSLPTATVS
jgi:hypothetical protein